jgi:hypothetical protein
VLTLIPLPGVDAIRALRWILKGALRQHGMKCLSVEIGDVRSQSSDPVGQTDQSADQ